MQSSVQTIRCCRASDIAATTTSIVEDQVGILVYLLNDDGIGALLIVFWMTSSLGIGWPSALQNVEKLDISLLLNVNTYCDQHCFNCSL